MSAMWLRVDLDDRYPDCIEIAYSCPMVRITVNADPEDFAGNLIATPNQARGIAAAIIEAADRAASGPVEDRLAKNVADAVLRGRKGGQT